MIICLRVYVHFSSFHTCDLSHLNKKRQILDRDLNQRSQSAKQASHPLQGDDRCFVKVSHNVSPLFEQLVFPCCRHRHLFISNAFPTIWRLSLEHLCQSDILLLSSNGGWSDARKSFFAGCLVCISAWTPLCSLTILLTSIFVSEFLNTA